MAAEYYTSELFIHDKLCRQADETLAATLHSSWKKYKEIHPFLITWPASTVRTNDGESVNHTCYLDLRDIPKDAWRKTIIETLQLTRAYAVLLVEQKPEEVLAILESQHGTKSWRAPIQQRGDVSVLGNVTSRTDVDNLGYLWRPDRGVA